ncbi:MAG: lytic murein transglycosylase [Syntrophobacteraceae bacterium]
MTKNPASKKSRPGFATSAALFFFACMAAILTAGQPAWSAEDIYAGVKQKLVAEGFSSRQVGRLFQPAPAPMFKLVASTLRIRESQLNYDQFLAPSEIAKARNFIAGNQSAFRRAERAFGVEPGVIAAILLVETHFGSYTGKTPTLGVFATFALMEQKQNRDRVWKMLAPKDRERWVREAFDRKLLDRSAWAHKELAALLELRAAQNMRVDSFKGSVMGAVGWPQFLPSSLVSYGADGDGDGRIDLYNAEDAIFSTANYLRGHGWCEAKFPSDKEQVIWAYNHSKPYVRTILGIADRLKN